MVSCCGSLVQSRCGEGGALQTNITVCGEHSQCSGHTGFALAHGPCGFPIYTAQAPGCSIGSRPCVACGSSFWVLHKRADSVGPEFCAFPAQEAQAARSLTGTFSLRAVRLLPSAGPASFSVRVGRVCLLSVLGSWSLAATLPMDVNHPDSQEVFGYKLAACLQFSRWCRLRAEFAPFPSPLPPASRGGWPSPQPASSSLELLSLSFVLRMAGSVFG